MVWHRLLCTARPSLLRSLIFSQKLKDNVRADMLTGHTVSDHLLSRDPVSESDDDEESEHSRKVLHSASFEELARSHLQYDTVIWVLISLLLVLAWGVGIVMLLYLPVRRYVLNRDISSRKLFVTQDDIVYKVTRPSFLPFLGFTKITKRIPLHMVIDIIIEQGCLQNMYGIHTFRVESIALGKAAAVDELQVQGVSNPDRLRKVIISEAAKSVRSKYSLVSRFRSPGGKLEGSIRSSDFLRKLEEVERSVKRLEALVGASEADIEEC